MFFVHKRKKGETMTVKQMEEFERNNVFLPQETDYLIRYAWQMPVKQYPLHHHAYYEALYFLSGSIIYAIEGKQYRLDEGTLLLVAPYELHQPCDWPGERYERITFSFDGSLPGKLSAAGYRLSGCLDTSLPGYTNVFRLEGERRKEMRELLSALLAESGGQAYGKELAERALITQFFLLLCRASQSGAYAAALQTPAARLVQEIAAYLENHCAEHITLEKLEKKFYVSRYQLSRDFVRIVGCPPHRYLMQKRLVNAQRLLAEGIPPQQAARQCGFEDYSNFYRKFRAVCGTGPRGYRERIRSSAGGETVT